MDYPVDLSILIPSYNEKESLPELLSWIHRAIDPENLSMEIIIVDDGSDDGTWDTVKQLAAADSAIRAIQFRRNYGKSAALFCGFKEARGRVVVTMDADLQDSPEEVPEMYRMIVEDGWDVVSGWKQHRQDNKLTKNLPSKLYNATARRITGIKLHDMNCGLKAYSNDVVKNIEVYGEMHRYIPYLAKLSFLTRFGKDPMHFFGYTGILMFIVGFIMTIWIIIAKLVHQARGQYFRAVTDQPLFYLALLAVVLGVMLFLAGFIGEMISRNASERNSYNIKDTI